MNSNTEVLLSFVTANRNSTNVSLKIITVNYYSPIIVASILCFICAQRPQRILCTDMVQVQLQDPPLRLLPHPI